MIKENVYGNRKRLDWIRTYTAKHKPVVEFGCGTGVMISLPLLTDGYDVVGVDLDGRSISYGRDVFVRHGFDPERLRTIDVSDLEQKAGTIIASEVFEHISAVDASPILAMLRSKLEANGTLLLTVPNGYGWFELESFLWHKLGVGRMLEKVGVTRVIWTLKHKVLGIAHDNPYVNTLADDISPHVRRYTFSSVQRELRQNGFEVLDVTGSVLFAGPFTNMLFGGFKFFMSMNCALGEAFPRVASGFFVRCRLARSIQDVEVETSHGEHGEW